VGHWGIAVRGAVVVVQLSAAAPGPDNDERPDVARVFSEVASIRQLPRHALPQVKFLRREEYLAAVRTPSPPAAGALELQKELGLVASRGDMSVEERRLPSSDGFYSRRERTVYVLDEPARRSQLADGSVLAHECIHALQDQNGLFRGRPPKSTDGMLTQRALIEGDATLGELLGLARHLDRKRAPDIINAHMVHTVNILNALPFPPQRKLRMKSLLPEYREWERR